MITVNDQELIGAMVGNVFEGGYPEDFADEYQIRLRMIARGGMVGGLGPIAIMQLLRDFNISPAKPDTYEEVNDWRLMTQGTVVYVEGQKGTFDSVSTDGRLLVKIDGSGPIREVNASTVKVKAAIVEGVPDAAFEPHPDDELTDKQRLEEEKNAPPSKADMLFAAWQGVEAGETVMVEIAGESFEAEYVDVDGDKIAVLLEDEVQSFDPSQVTPTVKA